jgi:S-adenosylmethionine hydrolase
MRHSWQVAQVTYTWISFTTDYGLQEGYVATCAGVIATITPAARIIDVTHLVPPFDIRRGSLVLAQTVPYLPPAVHLAVVDPGVGTSRRAIAVAAGDSVLVGPDNGLLIPAAEALGGITSAHELTEARYRLPAVSATFHGRDIFAPAAAHLAAGVPLSNLGPPVDPSSLVSLANPETVVSHGVLTTEVLLVDHFGNLVLAARTVPKGQSVLITIGDRSVPAVVATTFADAPPGGLVVYPDSAGHLAIAVNGASAAAHLRCTAGDRVMITATRRS